jgi:hypothetical protein
MLIVQVSPVGDWESPHKKTGLFTTGVSGSYAANGVLAIANLTKGDQVSKLSVDQP